MFMEQKRDLKEAVRKLRYVAEGSPDKVIGHCILFERFNKTCRVCPFIIPAEGDHRTLCGLREAISLIEGTYPIK